MDEIHLTQKMLQILKTWDWNRYYERYLTYTDNYGHNYMIRQSCTNVIDNPVLCNTMYFRNDVLHRLDGPANIFRKDSLYIDQYWVKGREFNENEFNFFIKEIIT